MGEGELELCLPSPIFGRGAGGEGKDLSLHWDAPKSLLMTNTTLPEAALPYGTHSRSTTRFLSVVEGQ
jgi:hypothetical protein